MSLRILGSGLTRNSLTNTGHRRGSVIALRLFSTDPSEEGKLPGRSRAEPEKLSYRFGREDDPNMPKYSEVDDTRREPRRFDSGRPRGSRFDRDDRRQFDRNSTSDRYPRRDSDRTSRPRGDFDRRSGSRFVEGDSRPSQGFRGEKERVEPKRVGRDSFAGLIDPRDENAFLEIPEEPPRQERRQSFVKTSASERDQERSFDKLKSSKSSRQDRPASTSAPAAGEAAPAAPKLSSSETLAALKEKVNSNPSDLAVRFDLALIELKIAAASEAPSDLTPSASGRSRLATFWGEVASHLADAIVQVKRIHQNPHFTAKLAAALQQKMTALQRADLITRLNNVQVKLGRDPADILANITLAHLILLQQGASEGSLERLQKAHDLAYAESIFSEALRIELNEAEYAKAADMYRQVIQLQPDHSGALTNLAVHLYYRALPKILAEAETIAQEPPELLPEDSAGESSNDLQAQRTPASIKRVEIVEEVKSLLKRAVASNWNRRNYLCHYHWGYMLEIEEGNADAAKVEYSKALMINEKHFASHLNLGSILMTEEIALPHYRAAVKYSEGNMRVLPLFALSNALSRKGLFDEAVYYAKQAIVETEMKDPQAYYHLANIFLNNKKITDAIENYKKCVDIAKADITGQYDIAPAINNLIVTLRRAANMFISKGKTILDFGTAARFLAEAIELANKASENPDMIAIQRMNLAYCFMKASQPDLAARQMAIAITEAGQEFLDKFRDVKQSRISSDVVQQLEAHIELAQTAKEKTPDRARAHYNIAFCLFHMGEAAAAMGHLEEAVSHDANARSDYVIDDVLPPEDEPEKKKVKKSKKARRTKDLQDEDLVAAVDYNDIEAISIAEANDASLLSKKERDGEEVEETNEEQVAAQMEPTAQTTAPETSQSPILKDKSKKKRREAIEKAVYGENPQGVVMMSDQDVKTMKGLMPLLKSRMEAMKQSGEAEFDPNEIDPEHFPKKGETVISGMPKETLDSMPAPSAPKKKSLKKSMSSIKKKTAKLPKKKLVAKKKVTTTKRATKSD